MLKKGKWYYKIITGTTCKKGERKIMKKEIGITLIALVITIIVLLILAAVTISALTGDNGILKNAASAKQETEKTEILSPNQHILSDLTHFVSPKTAQRQAKTLETKNVLDKIYLEIEKVLKKQ